MSFFAISGPTSDPKPALPRSPNFENEPSVTSPHFSWTPHGLYLGGSNLFQAVGADPSLWKISLSALYARNAGPRAIDGLLGVGNASLSFFARPHQGDDGAPRVVVEKLDGIAREVVGNRDVRRDERHVHDRLRGRLPVPGRRKHQRRQSGECDHQQA